jgi:hypothetical protein
MSTPSRDDYFQGSIAQPHTSIQGGVPRLDEYLLESTRELNTITELVSRGELVGHDLREWMLAQVDFIIETIGNEGLELKDEIRSDLLQLLLAIANLNEQIRCQNSLHL